MRSSAPNPGPETSAVREIYAAINRNDIPAVLELLDPQIEWIEPDEYPLGGTTHGLADVSALLYRARSTWAEGGCEPERFDFAGDKIVVLVHVRVRLKDEVDWLEGRLGDVYTFHNGKVILKRTFDDWRQALDWAGIEAPDAT